MNPFANSFAVVCYLPDPLGAFLNRLRRELVPGCTARAHLTVLSPRSLEVDPARAAAFLHDRLRMFRPFRVGIAEAELFESTSVAYLGISGGSPQLTTLHDTLNREALAFDEPFPFHPHITLAQNFDPQRVPEVMRLARERWGEYRGPRTFELEVLTFVQNTLANEWFDLEHLPLAEPVTLGR